MNKNRFLRHVESQMRFGTVWKLADRCGITVPQLVEVTRGTGGEKLEQQVAQSLNYKESSWNVVRTTTNYKTVETVFKDAKSEGMWFCVANPAGSGKSEAFEDLFSNDATGSVKMVTAEEWQSRTFLKTLVQRLYGITSLETKTFRGKSWDSFDSSYKNASYFLDMVCEYFNGVENPILIIDEADKLRESALRTLIPLFNRTQDKLAVILSGTENLEREIARGVRLSKKGYDEIESRFGRKYIHMMGASYADITAIAKANGVESEEGIEMIWSELPIVEKVVTVKSENGSRKDMLVPFVEDMRRLKRMIKREVLIAKRRAA